MKCLFLCHGIDCPCPFFPMVIYIPLKFFFLFMDRDANFSSGHFFLREESKMPFENLFIELNYV